MRRVNFISNCFVIKGIVMGKTVRILIDTGSDMNLIGRNIIKSYSTKSPMVFQGMGGMQTWTLGSAKLEVDLNGAIIKDKFEVVIRISFQIFSLKALTLHLINKFKVKYIDFRKVIKIW